MRTFIAIELPPEIRDCLGSLQDKLKSCEADVKWVKPQNIHLTLKFLGDIDEKKIEKIKHILEDTAKDKNVYTLRISSLGAFPKINFPRVIWVGIDKGESETKELACELEEKIAKIGTPKEDRPFSSHITIGRVRSSTNRQRLVQNLNDLVDNWGKNGLEFSVQKIVLFKSTLTPQGPIYESLKEAHLMTT